MTKMPFFILMGQPHLILIPLRSGTLIFYPPSEGVGGGLLVNYELRITVREGKGNWELYLYPPPKWDIR